ncbi:hypothetical protein ZIOFF_052930 [Zingiber officinale]|uniref:Uncharacterized protein n=1 Tax=Zingiber officinale TaxID=94328 RepID=A0A8J5KPK1_ZINOF|nr:hypothetical protein ZIOFF_052930 [Zingiber officinale]
MEKVAVGENTNARRLASGKNAKEKKLICVFLYAFIFPKLPIVKYYRAKAAFEGSKTVTADLAAAEIQLSTDDAAAMEDPNQFERLSNKELLLQNIDYALDIFLIYVLTLSIFPGFIAEDTRSHSLGSCEAWRSRVDDNVDVLLGTQPWLPQCLYFFRSTKRIQGSETKCIGELVVCSSDYRYFLRCWTQLVMANWQRFAAARTLTATLRLITKSTFESSDEGLHKGAITVDLAAVGIQLSVNYVALQVMEDPNQFERLSNKELLV